MFVSGTGRSVRLWVVAPQVLSEVLHCPDVLALHKRPFFFEYRQGSPVIIQALITVDEKDRRADKANRDDQCNYVGVEKLDRSNSSWPPTWPGFFLACI